MGKIVAKRVQTLEKMGEETVFARYLECGNTRQLICELFEGHDGGKPGNTAFYSWLHADPSRWQRWKELRKTRAHIEADMALEEGMKANPENASAQRVKVDTLKWRAGVLNRDDYGPPSKDLTVNVGIANAWLQALQPKDQ